MKRCPSCKTTKALDDFPVDRWRKDGRASRCRDCDNERSRAYFAANRERVIARVRSAAAAKRGTRMCAGDCGRPSTSSRHHYCDECRRRTAAGQRRARRSGRGWAGFGARSIACSCCGESFVALAPHARFCSNTCRNRARDRAGRLTTSARGYGQPHQRARAAWKPLVECGAVDCARCGERILPGEAWHLDHDDHDKSRYLGPSHARCNLTAGAAKRHATAVSSARVSQPRVDLIRHMLQGGRVDLRSRAW